MVKRLAVLILAGFFLANIYGCVALLGGAVGGAGTAVWLSDKLTQEVPAGYERTIKAVKSALVSLKLKITKETVEQDITQVMSKYTDGKTIWIDIRKITENHSRVDVRVGGVKADKQAEDKILKTITRYL